MANKSLYKCTECGQEIYYTKDREKPFPAFLKCKAQDCDGKLFRVTGNITTDIAKGRLGHSENSYDIYGAEEPSKYTPMSVKYGNNGRRTDHLEHRY